jgi:GT2 family glycosyltransferase
MANKLWVLIATAGRPELLGRTLKFLAEAEKPPEYAGTLVVENGPPGGVAEIVRGFARQHRFAYLHVPEPNKSHALNCGLAQLEDGLLFLTDDDVRVDPHVLTAYVEAARDVPQGAFFGGAVHVDAPHGLPPRWMRRYYPQTIAEAWSLPHHAPAVVAGQTFMGTNWAAFARDLWAVGGFDTRLGPGSALGVPGDETEAQWRLLKRGLWAVYVPGAVVWHYLHPQFLDPQWVLGRTYRHGLTWGIRRTCHGQPLAGPLLRAAVGRMHATLKGLVLRLVGSPDRQFGALWQQAKWRGRWEGLLLGRQWDKLPQIPLPDRCPASARAA